MLRFSLEYVHRCKIAAIALLYLLLYQLMTVFFKVVVLIFILQQCCVHPCLCLVREYRQPLLSHAECILPFRWISQCGSSLSYPWASNNLQGNACTDCLSDQYWLLDLKDGVSFCQKIKLWEEVWMTKQILVFLF